MATTYLIISAEDAVFMDWTGLDQTPETCRKSLDQSLYLVSWSGEMPSTLDGITLINVMDHTECIDVVNGSGWYEESNDD